MKVLVVSDTHGDTYGLYEAVRAEQPFDVMLHMGDLCGYLSDLEAIAGSPQTACAAVSGNCDLFSELPASRDMVLMGHHIHMEHGFWPPYREDRAIERAHEMGAEIMMMGHTHKPQVVQKDGVWLINPGSLSRPRQADGRHTYIVLELEEGKEPVFTVKDIDSRA